MLSSSGSTKKKKVAAAAAAAAATIEAMRGSRHPPPVPHHMINARSLDAGMGDFGMDDRHMDDLEGDEDAGVGGSSTPTTPGTGAGDSSTQSPSVATSLPAIRGTEEKAF